MSVIFNEHDFGDLFYCGDQDVQVLNNTPSTVTIPGRDGVAFQNLTQGALTIKVKLTALGGIETRREKFSQLAYWLDVKDPCKLYLPDMQGRYYKAIPNGTGAITPYIDGGSVIVEFTAIEPAAYGDTHTETLTSGGTLALDIEGTYPTTISIAGKVTPDETTGRYGIRHIETGDWVHVKTTGENIPIHWIEIDGDTWGDVKNETWGEMHVDSWKDATHAILIADSEVDIEFNTGTRVLRINDAFTVPTLDSNWITLEPGRQTITNDLGTGDVTVTWTDRWL